MDTNSNTINPTETDLDSRVSQIYQARKRLMSIAAARVPVDGAGVVAGANGALGKPTGPVAEQVNSAVAHFTSEVMDQINATGQRLHAMHLAFADTTAAPAAAAREPEPPRPETGDVIDVEARTVHDASPTSSV